MKKGLIISIITAFFCIVFSESLYSQDYAITPITSERFPNPLGLEVSHSDSDHLYIVRQAGFIHRLSRSNPSDPSDVWIDVSDRIITGGERGLLGLAFHPDYPNNDTFFILYTFEEDDLLYSTVARFNAPGGTPDPDSEERLLIIEQSAANHNGGQLKFGPDGYLYIASGDGGGLENRFNSQDTGNLLGKILRIDVDTGSGYGIPSGNPFVGDSDGRDEIFAWGFRNPWRMSFDEATGNLWTADVGEKDWESIYVVEAGKNYGWPIVEGSNCFEDDDCDKDGLEMPLFEYPWGEDDTGRSITGGYVYRGSDNPSLFGKYIYGDFISGNMWALEVDHDNLEVISNSEIFQADFLIPSFGTDSDGEIYILRWGSEGQIYRFEPDDEPLSPPGVVSLIAPEDEAVDVPIDPTLSWEEVSEGESYRVQVSGDPEFDGLVVDESDLTETEFGVEGLDYETTYFWRVRASNEAGDGEWSEAWSFATEDEPLSPPGVVSLFAPEDEAVDVSIDPTLSWEEVSEVESYRVQVAGDPEFDDLVVDESDLTETEFEVEGLDYETTYFWRVRASNEAGDGEWSEAWSFATEDEPLSPPGMVMLASPVDEAVDVSIDPTLSWEEVSEGESYRVQVAGDPEFDGLVVDESDLTETEFGVEGLDYETTYFWRVRASNEAGDGEWGEAWSFTTEDEPLSPPGMVMLVSPVDEAVDVSIDPTLSWEEVSEGESYRVQVSGDPEFDGLVVDESDLTETEFEVEGLDYESQYYWRVRASNEAGDGEWSEAWSFTTEDEPLSPPGMVTLASPEDEAVDVSIDPTLSWEEVSEGESYRVQVSGDPEFDGLVVDESDLPETELEVEGLDYETTYFWRVRASNEAGDGEWSEAWSFTTEDEPLSPPAMVTLASPEDEAVDVSIDPTLSWEEVSEGESYRVQVSGDPEFEGLVVDESDLTETEFGVEDLDYETTYFWRVRASNEAGDGEWSEGWSFTTQIEEISIPEIITLVSPVNGADQVSLQPIFEWESDQFSLRYVFQISRDASFSEILFELDDVTSSILEPDAGLEFNNLYYWRVRGIGDDGSGPWSQVWSFRTVAEQISESIIESIYPNPFNPLTNIKYKIANDSDVLIEVYEITGRRVAVLINLRQETGTYTIPFDAGNLSSGIYILRLRTGNISRTMKFTLLK